MSAAGLAAARMPAALSSGHELIAGLDLGGTKIAAALADRSGLRARRKMPVPVEAGPEGLASAMHRLLEDCCHQAGVPMSAVDAVGVSSCGPFELDDEGRITLHAPNLPRPSRRAGESSAAHRETSVRTGISLEHDLSERLPAPVTIVNDAAAALLAEHRFGVLSGNDHCAYMTWSTGIGFGLMCDGRLLRGKRGNAGHAGHAVSHFTSPDDPVCGCGNVGDVESLAGGAALARAWGGSTEALFTALRAGDPAARRLVERALDAVASALYNLIVTLDLERIAIGGGLFFAQRDILLESLRERVLANPRRRGLAPLIDTVTLEPVEDPERTAALGALCIVMPPDWAAPAFVTAGAEFTR